MAVAAHAPGSGVPAATPHTYELGKLQRIKPIGSGSKSQVWLVQQEDEFFALKEISREAIKWKQEVDHVWNERRVLTELSQEKPPFLRCCQLHATFKDERALYFLLEFIPGAPLHKHFQAAGGFDEARAKFYCGELVEVLAALHGRGIIYRDLKASNVMLDARSGRLRLVDFGFAKRLQEPGSSVGSSCRANSVCGTEHAMAPEICRGDGVDVDARPGYTLAVDWWSLGVLAFEMLLGRPPFGYRDGDRGAGSTLRELAARSPSSLEFPAGEHPGPSARAFVAHLLQAEPEARLGYTGAHEVRRHPWFEAFDWQSVALGRALEPAGQPGPTALPEFDGELGDFAEFDRWDPAEDGEVDGDPFGDD